MEQKDADNASLTPPSKTTYDFSKFVNLPRLIIRDLNSSRSSSSSLTKYTKEQISQYLLNPESNEKALRNASIYLYQASSHYHRLINYFARMHTLSYVLIPYKLEVDKIDKKAFLKCYKNSLSKLDTMNIKHEMQKVFTTVFREDVFYGYIYEAKDSFHIMQLPSDYCKINSITDGCFQYSFDFSYFSNNSEKLEMWGDEFITKYNMYKSNSQFKWQEIDDAHCFCCKLNEDILYPSIPFASIFEGIYDIEDYKGLKKTQTELGNYKILGLEIPVDDAGNFLIEESMAKSFYSELCAVLPEYVGAFLTPMKVNDYSFEKVGGVDSDKVAEATRNFWDDAGVSSLVFGGGDKQSSASLKNSILADEQLVFTFARQLERNINKILKLMSGKYKFKINILDVTYFNQKDMADLYLKYAQASLPTKSMAAATLGLSPSDIQNMNFLETSILNMQEYVPLNISYTQGSNAGRPSNDDTGQPLSESGESTEINGGNENK